MRLPARPCGNTWAWTLSGTRSASTSTTTWPARPAASSWRTGSPTTTTTRSWPSWPRTSSRTGTACCGSWTALGVSQDYVKVAGGWLGEKLGRLKLNGRLFSRSPLSYLVELEALRLGIDGKAAGWQTLRILADHDDRLDQAHLDELTARAKAQKAAVDELRRQAAAAVFVTGEGRAAS